MDAPQFSAPVDSHSQTGGQIPLYKNNPILIGGYGVNTVERYRYTYSGHLIKFIFSLDGWLKNESLTFPEEQVWAYSAVWGDFGVVIFPGYTYIKRR